MVVSLKKVRSISRIRSKNFGKRTTATTSSSPSATYNEVVSRYDYAHLAIGKKEQQQQIAFNLSTVSSLDNIHELESRYPASEDQRRRETVLDEDNRSTVSIDDALSYHELGYGYKTNLGPTNLWQLVKKDKDMNNEDDAEKKSTQSTMSFIHAVQKMVDCVSCSDASSKCDASTKNSLAASSSGDVVYDGPPLQPTMSYISEGDLPTQDSQPIGGPKYYIVMNAKTRESKVYYENMPRKGDLFDVPEERGYEVVEYGFFGQNE